MEAETLDYTSPFDVWESQDQSVDSYELSWQEHQAGLEYEYYLQSRATQ
jgi:hypothetical protein